MENNIKSEKDGKKAGHAEKEVKEDFWELRLYVAGQSEKSITALSNLKQLCEKYLQGNYRIEIVDLIQEPERAREDQIIALPTLVRKLPPPMKKIIGDLSKTQNVLIGLELKQKGEAASEK